MMGKVLSDSRVESLCIHFPVTEMSLERIRDIGSLADPLIELFPVTFEAERPVAMSCQIRPCYVAGLNGLSGEIPFDQFIRFYVRVT